MHPDRRRRRGRAIRKQRRLARQPGTATVRVQLNLTRFRMAIAQIGTAAFLTGAAVSALGHGFATALRMEVAEARFRAISLAYPTPVTLERLDMTTVAITAPATAPDDLKHHLRAFAGSLHDEGITATLTFIRTCIICGCTDDTACSTGCSWISEVDDLCTACDTPDARTQLDQHTDLRNNRTFMLALAGAAQERTETGGE